MPGFPASRQDGVYGPQTSQAVGWSLMNPSDNSFPFVCQIGFFA